MDSGDMAWKIRTLRAKNNLTLEQVAREVGVGKSTVRKWETGMIANMRRDKIAALAAALHTTPAYLMGWPEEHVGNAESEESRALREIFSKLPYGGTQDIYQGSRHTVALIQFTEIGSEFEPSLSAISSLCTYVTFLYGINAADKLAALSEIANLMTKLNPEGISRINEYVEMISSQEKYLD